MRSRATAAAVVVSALAASLAGCMSVSDAEKPRPSGSTARPGGKDGAGPGGVTADGRGTGPRRMGHKGDGKPAGGDDKAKKSSGSAEPTPSEPGEPSHPVQPSGPEPVTGGAQGGSDGHGGRPGHPKPTPSHPDHPATPPASPPPSTPTAAPTPPPSSPPPPPSSQASGPSPVAPMSSQPDLYEEEA
ncbi:hypothetical protein [Streptomyces decoyicus]